MTNWTLSNKKPLLGTFKINLGSAQRGEQIGSVMRSDASGETLMNIGFMKLTPEVEVSVRAVMQGE